MDYCKFYRFAPRSTFPEKASNFLLPPSGANLLSLLLQDRELRAEVNEPFLSRGLRLGLRPQENKIEVVKHFEDVIISHPYHLASDTFQRLVFYMAALRTNSDSVLVFEEPEAHAFPYYTKYLAESIALDERGNQYFVSTHNPYFLLPVLEKTLADDIAVFITYYEDYQTKVMQLPPDDLERIFDEIDVFSNIETFPRGLMIYVECKPDGVLVRHVTDLPRRQVGHEIQGEECGLQQADAKTETLWRWSMKIRGTTQPPYMRQLHPQSRDCTLGSEALPRQESGQ